MKLFEKSFLSYDMKKEYAWCIYAMLGVDRALCTVLINIRSILLLLAVAVLLYFFSPTATYSKIY